MTNQFSYFLKNGRKYFIDGSYDVAEKYLAKAMQLNNREPELYQMLATIFYDRGQFKKAIQTFKRALEIDPDYTDASVGLSIVLNDIGRYDEGQKIFDMARKRLDSRQTQNSDLEMKLAQKHAEIGQLYFVNKMYPQAIEQFLTAQKLHQTDDGVMQLANSLKRDQQNEAAVKQLRLLVRKSPNLNSARLLLGQILFESEMVEEAVSHWENILLRDPANKEANLYIKRAQSVNLAAHRSIF